MSTFDGIVEEFPNIRIDYFRHHPGKTSPVACFLSHIHSDHLLGLETLRMPFVYCSATTRRLLLKMEKYPHRINFSKGVLEARRQTYKHLKHILRPLPLQTAVDIELGPKSKIQVTLLDANHCPGAVMFLIEGDGKAILYTGDIRAEPWWINALARSPALIPYLRGLYKQLDCIYLDTTFASHADIHHDFPTKAEGLQELMRKVMKCPPDSIFYFRAWTLGYEDVWVFLGKLLESQIHVDRYQHRLFQAVAEDGLGAEPGPALQGFQVGNGEQRGYLTTESATRIHSCEPGMTCHLKLKKSKHVVWITPIISRLRDGTEVAEIGAGGGRGDLYQQREVELGNDAMIESLRTLCRGIATDPDTIAKLETALSNAQFHNEHRLVLDGLGFDPEAELTIKDFLRLLADGEDKQQAVSKQQRYVQNVIHFPYSRHSSYSELRHLVELFRPRDICPCTVDLNNWEEQNLSMQSLFGDLCSRKGFKYDQIIQEEVERRRAESGATTDTNESQQHASQRTDSQRTETQDPDEHFQSAEDLGTDTKLQTKGQMIAPEISERSKFLTASENGGEQRNMGDKRSVKERLRDAWRAANNGSDIYYPPSPTGNTQSDDSNWGIPQDEDEDMTSELPPEQEPGGVNIMNVDGGFDMNTAEAVDGSPSISDLGMCQRAYEAAVRCLESGDSSDWQNIRLQSLGWGGHLEEEIEL